MSSKAKFSNKTKEEIFNRDGMCCIICKKQEYLQFHHCKFGMEVNRWPDRNNVDQWCILCYNCHHNLHNLEWKDLRQTCIYYVKWSHGI